MKLLPFLLSALFLVALCVSSSLAVADEKPHVKSSDKNKPAPVAQSSSRKMSDEHRYHLENIQLKLHNLIVEFDALSKEGEPIASQYGLSLGSDGIYRPAQKQESLVPSTATEKPAKK